jgi:hypothetical protein
MFERLAEKVFTIVARFKATKREVLMQSPTMTSKTN